MAHQYDEYSVAFRNYVFEDETWETGYNVLNENTMMQTI